MSFLLTSLFVAGGVLLGRWIARGGAGNAELPPAEATDKALPASTEIVPKKSVDPDWSVFPCALGDVIVRAGGEEAWLAGALVLSESSPVAVIFVAPEAGGDHAILVRPRPAGEIVWFEPLPRDEIVVGAEPPTSLEVRGVRYERLRRLPLRAERIGAGAPDVGDAVIYAEYAGAGAERVLVLSVPGAHGGGPARVWRGVALEPGMYDVLPSGKATLGD
jgi:hypothetical protein